MFLWIQLSFIQTLCAVCFLLFLTSRAWDKEKYLSHARVKTKKHLPLFLYRDQYLPSLLFLSSNITLSTLLILAVCRTRVKWTSKQTSHTVESLWLSGRASERGIRRSEVRFLVRTSLSHVRDKTEKHHSLSLVLLNKSDYMNHYSKDSDWLIGTCSIRVYKMFREMRAPWSVRTSSLYFHKARALRHTNALLRYNARSLRHRYERAQFAIHIKEIKKLVPRALLSSIST